MTARYNTVEASFPWALPPVTRVYLTPRARLRRFRNRLAASAFAHDIRAAWRSTFWVRVVAAGLGLAFYVILTRHSFVGWDGLHEIPTAGAR